MRKVRQDMLRPRGSRPALPKPIPACSRRTHRVAGAPAVGLLAPAFGQALPSLAGVPAAYSHSENTDTLLDLCRVLVKHDLGDESLWNSTGKQPLRFAAAAVKKAIEERCGDLLTRNVNYELSIQDTIGSYGHEELRAGALILSVDCSGCGYLKIGPALTALEREEAGLEAALYHLLRLSLYRWTTTRMRRPTPRICVSGQSRKTKRLGETMRSPTSKEHYRLSSAARTSCRPRITGLWFAATAAAHGRNGSKASCGLRR